MTHPLPLSDSPIFAGMLSDPEYGPLAKELFERQPIHNTPLPDTNYHAAFPRRSSLALFNHPLTCPGCSTASFEFQMLNPPAPLNRGLALPPGSATAPTRLQPARVDRPRKSRQKVEA